MKETWMEVAGSVNLGRDVLNKGGSLNKINSQFFKDEVCIPKKYVNPREMSASAAIREMQVTLH